MNPVLIQIAIYVRDLLDYDESLIKFGRYNGELDGTDTGYIVVDELASVPAGRTEVFDEDAESMEYGRQMVGDFTVNFYGDDAYTNAKQFQILGMSQAGYELQRDLGIAVYHPTNATDLKFLSGTQYANRYEVELKVQYRESVAVDTLRIDTAEITVLNNK